MTQTLLRCIRWAALCAACLYVLPSSASAETYNAETMTLLKQVKREQRELLMRGAHNKVQRKLRAHRARTYNLHYGHSLRPARPLDRVTTRSARPNEFERRDDPARALFVPNVNVSNPAHDLPPGDAAQAEPSMAAWGQYVLAAWNDGNELAGQRQGYGYSVDGGATFTDGGSIPNLPGHQWLSDPVITVNEATGEFFYCGLNSPSANISGIGIARGTFSGSTFTWDTPVMVRSGNIFDFFDKCWIAADSSNGNLYVTYTHFVASSDTIIFQRSTDNGLNWDAPIGLSSDAAAGFVQGSRPAVGPNGELYVAWSEIGPVDADFIRMRVSTNQGASFGPERTVTGFFDNFGTGAPGFNRERSIAFPGIAVDRTSGPNRGRVYVTWNESLNWFDDLLGTGGGATVPEAGDSDTPATATPFTIGDRLQGAFGGGGDQHDYWRFGATQGQSYLFWVDDAGSNFYRLKVVCTDGTTELTSSGDTEPPAGNQSFQVWTAPTTGTYYLFMRRTGGSATPYTIRTGVALPGGERGRDQRDVFVASSLDGATWSTPARMNDGAASYDNWLPEVAVGGDGNVYSIWYDWREAPLDKCGGLSNVYFAVSNNGGNSWVSLGAITDMQTPWTDVESNTIPNQGDYISLYANTTAVYACWADGRILNPNVMAGVVPLAPDTVQVTVVNVNAAPNQITLGWENIVGRMFSADLERSVNGGPFALTASLTSDASGLLAHTDTDVTPGARYNYRLRIDAGGTVFIVGAVSVVAPSEKLALTGARPNPVSTATVISFDIPSPGGNISLAVFDGTGRLIRTLVNGAMSPGPQTSTWDLRDDKGNKVNAGMYFVQLRAGDEEKSRRIVVVP